MEVAKVGAAHRSNSRTSACRAASSRPRRKEKFIPLCPDFVIEVASPSDALSDLREKMDEYRSCGVRLAWLVLPESAGVHVYAKSRWALIHNPLVRNLLGECGAWSGAPGAHAGQDQQQVRQQNNQVIRPTRRRTPASSCQSFHTERSRPERASTS